MFYRFKTALMKKIIAGKQRNKPFDYEAGEAYALPEGADYTVNNSYYFSAHDSSSSLYCRLGLRNGRSEVWFAYSENGEVYRHNKMIYDGGDSPLAVTREGNAWRVRFSGELVGESGAAVAGSFDGVFSSDETAVDFFSHMPAVRTAKAMAFQKWNKKFFAEVQANNQVHYEQVGRLDGVLSLDGAEKPVSLPCVRDHSFGKRDWDYMNNHLWLMAVSDAAQLNFSMVSYPAMTMLEVGNYKRAGEPQKFLIKADYDRAAIAGKFPDRLGLTLETDDKTTLDVTVEVESSIPYMFDGKYEFNECIASVTVNGERMRGIFELGRNVDANRIFNGVDIKKLKS